MALFTAIQIFRGRPSWGQVRSMGTPLIMFTWINIIFGLVLFEGLYGIVGFIINTPLWIDIILMIIIFSFTMMVYCKLCHRDTFKPKLFATLVLIPLGIPGIHLTGKLVRIGAVEIVQHGMFYVPKWNKADDIANAGETSARRLAKTEGHYPRHDVVADSGYKVGFADTHAKGTLGDWMTVVRLTARGYKKLTSKINKIHGIDGVYAKYDKNGNITEILIIENKVDNAKLTSGQMSDKWVSDLVEKMSQHSDLKLRKTAELIKDNAPKVRKELWHHDLASGKTTIYSLDFEGRKIRERTENYIGKLVRKRCEAAQTNIQCVPVTL